MSLDGFHSELKKAFCNKCKTFFFTHHEYRIKNQICAVCENTNENSRTVRNWES